MKSLWQTYGPKSSKQYFGWSIVLLLLGYALGSRALDTGSLGQYGITLLLFYFCVQFLVRGIRLVTDVKRR